MPLSLMLGSIKACLCDKTLAFGALCVCVALSACASQNATPTTPSHGPPHDTPPAMASAPDDCAFYPQPETHSPSIAMPPNGVDRPITRSERKILGKLFTLTEKVRGLRFKRPVNVRVQSDKVIRHFLQTEVDNEEMQEAYLAFGALGLIDRDTDLEGMLLDVLGEQVVGYYNPEKDYLAVRDDILIGLDSNESRVFQESHAVLVHEMVHALQAQRLGLKELHGQKRDTDGDAAFQALVEGDATLAMLADFSAQMGVPLAQLTANLPLMDKIMPTDGFGAMPADKLSSAPTIVKALLLSPYLDGLRFAASLYNKGGWQQINTAYQHPPQSMRTVLHPDASVETNANAEPLKGVLPPSLPGGHSLVFQDTLGELVWRVYLGQHLSSDMAQRAAEGWTADRLGVYRNTKGEYAALWIATWENHHEAKEALEAAQSSHGLSLPAPCRDTLFAKIHGNVIGIGRALPEKAIDYAMARLN